ncbi:sensor histidine kinase, partial [Neobacillus niacini]|uniref:sensor histidine kinase n=1 Tax=Neobacillus niacini TaxID=86668 RepID=UPI003002190F
YYDKAPIYYKNNNKEYLSFLRLLRDPDNQKELGVIRIDFSPSYISEIIDQFSNDYLQITNFNNEPLLGGQADDLFSSCHSNNSWVKDEETGKEYICVTHTSNKTGFKISSLISKDHLYKDVRDFDRFIYILIGVCLLFSLLISYYMANYLLRPLYLLKNRIQFFQTKSQSSPQSMDEFAELAVAYDGMLSEIDYLVEEVYEITKQNAEAEFKALQSQMDPHFIFNTLESINMKAISNDQYELSDMIVELGKLIRFRLRNEEQQILLGEEITFTKTYVNIMKNRLEDALEVDWDVEDEVLEFPVPKYIIQPLIENSIMHGYGDNIQSLKVLITIRRDQQTLKLTVKDNGSGITDERLLKIEEALHGVHLPKVEETKKKNNRGSIALVNINRRLQLIYGINSRLHISSITGIGTMVDIEIKK